MLSSLKHPALHCEAASGTVLDGASFQTTCHVMVLDVFPNGSFAVSQGKGGLVNNAFLQFWNIRHCMLQHSLLLL